MKADAKFNAGCAVWVDTSEYNLAPPGMASKSPGVILAVTEGLRVCYGHDIVSCLWLRRG